MTSLLLLGVGLLAGVIRIDICHAQATDALSGGANTTTTLGGIGSPSGSTVSTVGSMFTITAGGVMVGTIGRRSREGDVDYTWERLV